MSAGDLKIARQTALAQARRGDSRALGDLLESFRPYVRVIVHSLRDQRLQGRVDDSDLIQDAFLEAQRSFEDFRGHSVAELAVWLRCIVVRTSRRSLRQFGGTGKRDPAREQLVDDLAELADSGSSPSAIASRHEEAARMAEALAQLPEEMQQVLLARHVDDLPHATIADRLGRTEGATRMLYLRALRRLRELYHS
jgi:RNA polymerase sigma-70 factor (ECF subfamily)